jgi:hypothetical protein
MANRELREAVETTSEETKWRDFIKPPANRNWREGLTEIQ